MSFQLIVLIILLVIYGLYIIHTVLTWTIPVWKEKQYFEAYASFGMISFIGIIVLVILYSVFTGLVTTLTPKITSFFVTTPLISLIELLAFICAWCIWTLGLIFLMGSFLRLKKEGEATDNWESTTKFIEKFPYSIIRHPMFCGSSLFAISFFLFYLTPLSLVLALLAVVFLYLASRGEDNFDKNKFPDEYAAYIKRVPRWNFILGVIRYVSKK